MTPPKALVTGAAGFIGSHVADHCLALGMEVMAVDDLSGGFRRNVPARATWVQGDLRDPDLVRSVWARGPFDYVYHLAAYAAEGLSHHVRRFNYQTNLVASVNLINEAVNGGTKHFVFASSIAVYGSGQLPLREDMEPRPEDPYGISKYAVELDLKAAQHVFGLPFTIFRPHNVYGERQNIADRYRNVIGIFMNQLLRGEPMTVFGDGSQTRAFTHIDDVAPLLARAPLVPAARNEVFNVGADEAVSVAQLASEVAAALGKPARTVHLPARPEVVHAFSDHSKVRRVFAPLPPAVDLKIGLRRMADWVQALGPGTPAAFGDIEIVEKLPASWRT
jgi:UDP-glucose 4-epimerase